MDEVTKMDQIRIIGITGRKFSGKDTAGNYFVEKYGFERMAYADPLKKAAKDIFDFNDEQLYGNAKEINDSYWDVTPRQVLQFMGTNLFRNHICELLPDMGKDIWVNVLKRKALNTFKKYPNAKIVVTDVRFPNELQAIKDLGGVTIKLQRNNAQEKVTKQFALDEMMNIGSKLQNGADMDPQELSRMIKDLEKITTKLQQTDAIKDTHESEALIDDLEADYVFDNNGTKDELFQRIVEALDSHDNL
jgi:Deoxynucleotide monophosphate kinase